MVVERQIYLLDPRELSPETIAVTFAKTSRSAQSFREIADELSEEKSAQFHEKWVVGYGHASVAEHAVLHIAVENVSRLAIECLESNRLASYTEKSTRYQKWDNHGFYLPDEIIPSTLADLYKDTCQYLFDTYQASLAAVKAVSERMDPRRQDETEAAWDRRIRSRYVDVCRFLLPASSLANVGITANARVLEHAIQKMLSHPLAEVRAVGAEIKTVSQVEVPTLVKYADHVPHLEKSRSELTHLSFELGNGKPDTDWCRLISFEKDGEERVLAAALYRFGEGSYAACLEQVERLSMEARQHLAEAMFSGLSRYDVPLRELEHTWFTFDITIDQGGYFELKRHRMMTQSPQILTTNLGYAMPRSIVEAGFEEKYRAAMERAQTCYFRIAEHDKDVASYVVPNAYNRRVLLTINLRSAYHLCALRAAPNAHFSVRRLAQRMAAQIRNVYPLLSRWLDIPQDETWEQIEKSYFVQVS